MDVIHVPRAPARPWFRSVAIRMPRIIGIGFLNLAANKKASNCVLSPISASVTTPVLTIMASKFILTTPLFKKPS
jgi:hypothetical protein